MTLTLWTYPGNVRAQKALIAAEFGGVEIEVPEDFKMGETNKTPQFLAKHPAGKVPLLDTPNGPVFESNAIARYVARLAPQANLEGKCFYSKAVVDEWVDYLSMEVSPVVGVWVYPILGYGKVDSAGLAAAKEAVYKHLSLLDGHLTYNTFFAGNYITLADIVGYSVLSYLFQLVLDPKIREQYPRVTRWFTTCVNQPQFKKVIGEFKFATVETPVPGVAASKSDKKEKKDKKAEEPKKEKKEKAKKEEVKAADPADYEDEDKPKPKPKSALDELPPSKMVLDNVKRLFSNEGFETAVTKFWSEFDAAGYSIWEAQYNYNSENKVLFMTCNLVGGYLQRLDSLRKYGYAALNIAGPEAGPYTISGCFLVRGTQIPAELKECPDSEYYTWSKIDTTTDKGKARFAQLWNDDVVDKHPVIERRFFK